MGLRTICVYLQKYALPMCVAEVSRVTLVGH